MRKQLEELEQLLNKVKSIADNPNRRTYKDEEEALHHLSLVAQLVPGEFVTFQNSVGEICKGVFFGLDEHSRPRIATFDPEDNGHNLTAVPPVNLIFEA